MLAAIVAFFIFKLNHDIIWSLHTPKYLGPGNVVILGLTLPYLGHYPAHCRGPSSTLDRHH